MHRGALVQYSQAVPLPKLSLGLHRLVAFRSLVAAIHNFLSAHAITSNRIHTHYPTFQECLDCALAHRVPRPHWLRVSVLCVCVSVPPANHEHTNRLTRIYRETAHDPTGEVHHRVVFSTTTGGTHHRVTASPDTTQRRLALLGEGTESLTTNARSADGDHRGRGRRIWVEENWTLFSSFSFFLDP